MMSRLRLIYQALPASMQSLVLSIYLGWYRFREEFVPVQVQLLRSRFCDLPQAPRVVYVTGMPRTGTSLAKNYLGSAPGLTVTKFQTANSGFQYAWQVANQTSDIVLDKATRYIQSFRRIYGMYGNQVAFCCIVRDPRDQLTSLFETELHPEIYRNKQFWRQWANMYGSYLKFAAYLSMSSHWYLLRYEDLARWPVQAKLDFLSWLDLDIDKKVITVEYDIIHKEDNQDWKVQEQHKVNMNSVGRWKRVDNPEMKALFQYWQWNEEANTLMNRFGYTAEGLKDCPLEFTGLTVFQPQVLS